MGKIISHTGLRITTIVFLSFCSFLSFAQGGVDIDVNIKKESEWYQQPWVWIVGGAVFILLLVALLRGGGSKNK